MERKIYSKFLNIYNPKMRNVLFDGKGFAYATDGCQVLRWREDKERKLELKVEELFIGDWVKFMEFNKNDYVKWYAKLPLVNKIIDCNVCDGDTEVEWKFSNYRIIFNCPACDGKGYCTSKNEIPNRENTFIMDGGYLSDTTAKLLIILMDRDEVDTISLKRRKLNLIRADFKDCTMLFALSLR